MLLAMGNKDSRRREKKKPKKKEVKVHGNQGAAEIVKKITPTNPS
jgi:hypothetical protein